MPPRPARLPVFKTVWEAHRAVYGNLGNLMRAATLPVGVFALTIVVAIQFPKFTPIAILGFLFLVAGMARLDPIWCRFLLLPKPRARVPWNPFKRFKQGKPSKPVYPPGSLRRSFLVLVPILVLAAALILLHTGPNEIGRMLLVAGFVLLPLGGLMLAYASIRAGLVTTANNIGADLSEDDSWRATEGQILSLLATELIAFLSILLHLVGPPIIIISA